MRELNVAGALCDPQRVTESSWRITEFPVRVTECCGYNLGSESDMALSAACRICDSQWTTSQALVSILDLGPTPLANRLLRAEELDQPEPTFPLELVFCPTCSLLQITETVPPEILFRDYVYFSSYSDTMLRHAEASASQLLRSRHLTAESLVIEAASNDGYLLQYFQQAGVPVLGIEPAVNVAEVARQKGIDTLAEFFNLAVARQLSQAGKSADVFLANNVLAHVADLHGFVAGIREILKPEGIAVIEAPYVREMIEQVEFDTIYHEHLCYFSLTALKRLFEQHDLVLVDVERLPIHGGSLRIFAQRKSAAHPQGERVTALLAEEAQCGMDRVDYYRDFSQRVRHLRVRLRELLGQLKNRGASLAAYGAAAKGCILLHYCGIGRETLDFVVDRSPVKQGKFLPGSHLPILGPEEILARMPAAVLLLAWNVREEIVIQQQAYIQRGGKFLVPVPEPRVL